MSDFNGSLARALAGVPADDLADTVAAAVSEATLDLGLGLEAALDVFEACAYAFEVQANATRQDIANR